MAGRDLVLLRPRDAEALLSEEEFSRDEFLPYWAELWPSATALARVVGARALRGARTLELGCGLGLVSLAAAAAGGRVTATDWAPDSITLLERNAARNGLKIEGLCVDWSRARGDRRAGAVGSRAGVRRPVRGAQRRGAAPAAAAADRRARGDLARRPRPA